MTRSKTPTTATDSASALRELAHELGVQPEYRSVEGERMTASAQSLRSVFTALGIDADSSPEAALAEWRATRAAKLVDAVHVCWDGEPTTLRFGESSEPIECVLRLESGDEQELTVLPGEDATLPAGLPYGYHELQVASGARAATSRVICAPRHVRNTGIDGAWGVFVPLYAARSADDWGIGDLGSARALLELMDETGGALVGSTPLLATFLGDPFEPSPYAPVSRLFWNESYADLTALPEVTASRAAHRLVRDRDVLRRRDALRRLPLVDHQGVYELKRSVLEACAEQLADSSGERRDAFEAWRTAHPLVGDYAAFRSRLEGGDAATTHYHQYVQWAMETQLADLDSATRAGLYLDLPVGVHPDGFDRAHFSDLFAPGMSVGAPPDPLAAGGQDWGLPPLHPVRLRDSGYAYLIESMRHLMRHARAVRIDHVMGMHRLFWIPSELEASDGVYVGYHADEQWAIVCLESHRTGCAVVGEDLGTVPDTVREAMTEHQASRMYVMQFELDPGARDAIRPVPANALASVDTHDTPMWATAWTRLDQDARSSIVDHLREQGVLDDTTKAGTGPDPVAVHAAALRLLARGDAGAVVASLEDLWGETEPQNVPGTGSHEAPNWVRRTTRTIEEIASDEVLMNQLKELTTLRSGAHDDAAANERVRHDASRLTEQDLYLFGEGTHNRMHRVLGSHPCEVDGVAGTWFGVWAPNADHVSVVGDFNHWSAGEHPLASEGSSGIWQGWIPGVRAGTHYKYHVASPHNGYQVEKADPYARLAEEPPKTASVVWEDDYAWRDSDWMRTRGAANGANAPMSVYELHVGSWMRVPEDGDRSMTWRELAPRLIEHLQRTGFTHVELMPIMEHPFYGSWGYQTTGYFAPSSRYGTPDEFKWFVDELHAAGIGVLLDWVPSHFPTDQHGLGFFDGTHLYEHADPRQGFHPDWKSWIFNYSRPEVCSFLLSSALYWLEEFHVDGLRVDAVASMLYLDYSRKEGEWIPNAHGGRENLEAIDFLRRLNEDCYTAFPDIAMVAEESTAWGGVSRPTYVGGLGFGMKWDMGWMHDTLQYFGREPIHRRHHQGELTFRQIYAYTENFMLPLSHDEVVHGKGSLITRMPGDEWQQFANLRLLLAYMWLLPGKKLLFQGGEFAQGREWNHDASLDWHLLDQPQHAGIQALVGDLNRLYRATPALHQREFEHEGFAWVDTSDEEASVFSWLRHSATPGEGPVLVVMNATPVLRHNYRVGVPQAGSWRELLNTDASAYWGGGQGNLGAVETTPVPIHGHGWSLNLTLPPLGAVVLQPEGGA
ncbi:MAG: 1,4-alpha-glucan branching enzyme [Thermoleophilia bacterium]|nr:1,4-alpha-glucan branching enzyme [Thermoleophilia bacterium]